MGAAARSAAPAVMLLTESQISTSSLDQLCSVWTACDRIMMQGDWKGNHMDYYETSDQQNRIDDELKVRDLAAWTKWQHALFGTNHSRWAPAQYFINHTQEV